MHVIVEDLNPMKFKIFNQPFIRFIHGSPLIGYKTKYRFTYAKLIEILKSRGLNQAPSHPTISGISEVNESFDPLWNKICRRIILVLLM